MSRISTIGVCLLPELGAPAEFLHTQDRGNTVAQLKESWKALIFPYL
jgi:hypothetical protein